MSDARPRDRARLRAGLRVGATAAAFLLLQLLCAMYYWLPELSLASALRPTWDCVVVAAIPVAWSFVPRPPRLTDPGVYAVVTLIVIVLFALGLAQGLARREFGYDVAVVFHAKYVLVLLGMLWDAESGLRFALYMAVLAVAALSVVLAVWFSVRQLHRFGRAGQRNRLGVGLALAGLAVSATFVSFNGPLAKVVAEQVDEGLNLEQKLQEEALRLDVEASRNSVKNPLTTLPEDRRPTILAFVVESYGTVLFDRGRAEFEPFREFIGELGAELADAGFHARTRALRAPVFGGSSWLANATIMCGVAIRKEKLYETLHRSNVRCLPAPMRDAGYHTVFAASNTTYILERYAARFPFHEFYIRDTFGYRGPRMAWSYMPDQFVIDFVDRNERISTREDATFVVYKLSSSHHPWKKIPPFIDDWGRIGDGSVFNEVPSVDFRDNRFLGGQRYTQAYSDSVRYSMRTAIAYVKRLAPRRPLLVVLVGDHQPRRPIAQLRGDPWNVPVHVLSRDRSLIDSFAFLGYEPGLVPGHAPSPPGLELLGAHWFGALGAWTSGADDESE